METTLSWIVVLFIFKQNTHCQAFGKTYADFQHINWNYHSRLLQKNLYSNIVNDFCLQYLQLPYQIDLEFEISPYIASWDKTVEK